MAFGHHEIEPNASPTILSANETCAVPLTGSPLLRQDDRSMATIVGALPLSDIPAHVVPRAGSFVGRDRSVNDARPQPLLVLRL